MLCWTAAVASTPGYRFGGQWVSDLGVGGGAVYFNAGAIIAGALAVPFAVSLAMVLKSERLLWLGGGTLAAAGVALVGVGLFTENAGDTHLIVSIAFFFFALLSLFLLVYPFHKSASMRPWGAPSTALLVATGIVMLAAFRAGPLTETAAVILIIVWSILIAWRLRVYLCITLPRTQRQEQAT